MKFGTLSPDIKFIQIEESDDGSTVSIEVRARKKSGKIKTVAKIIPAPANGQDSLDWLKSNVTKIGAELLF